MSDYELLKRQLEQEQPSSDYELLTRELNAEPNVEPSKPTNSGMTANEYFTQKATQQSGPVKQFGADTVNSLGASIGLNPLIKNAKTPKAQEALKIINGQGSDKQKMAQLKQVFPAARFGFSKKEGRFMVVNGQKLKLFEQGTENYPTLPNVIFQDKTRPKYDQLLEILSTGGNPANEQYKYVAGQWRKVSNPKVLNNIKQNVVRGRDAYGNETVTVKQDIKLDSPMFNGIPKGTYYLDKPGLDFSKESILTGAKTAGEFVNDPSNQMTVIGGGAAKLPTILKTAFGAGAGAGFGQAVEEKDKELKGGKFSVANIAKESGYAFGGTAAGGLLFKWTGGLWRLGKKIIGKGDAKLSSIIDRNGNLTDDFVQVLESKGMTVDDLVKIMADEKKVAKLKLSEQELKEITSFIKTTKSIPTTGQATGDPTHQANEFAGVSGKLYPKVQATTNRQDQGLHKYTDDLINKTGVDGKLELPKLQTDAGKSVKNAFQSDETAQKEIARNIYEQAKKSVGIDANIPRNNFTRKVNEIISEHREVLNDTSIGKKLLRKLSDFGITGKGRVPFNIKNSEKFRQWLGESGQASEKELRIAINSVKKELDIAVESMGKGKPAAANLFLKGREVVRQRKELFNAKDTVQKIIEGKIKTTKLVSQFRNGNIEPDDIKKIVSTLQRTPQGKVAHEKLKGALLKELKDVATGKDVAKGVPRFEVTQFRKKMDAMRQELEAVLSKSEMAKLEKLYKAANMREMNNPPTAARTRLSQSLMLAGKENPGIIEKMFRPFLRYSGQKKATILQKAAKKALKRKDAVNTKPSSLIGVETNRRLNSR